MNHRLTRSNVEMFAQPTRGTIDEAVAPERPGRIKYQGSYWPAQLYQSEEPTPLVPGSRALVVGRCGITLLVLPA